MTQAGDGESAEGWTIRKVVAWATDDLKKRGSSSPRLDVELLLGEVLKLERLRLILDAERPLSKEELTAYRALHKRRRAGEPIAYLLGRREFYGRMFRVDKRVLVPRPDTETLVEVALERTKHLSMCCRTLDLCTGSGCVAVTLAKERPTTGVVAADISVDALRVTRENAFRLGAFNVGLARADLFKGLAGLRGKLDLITANPPYIPAGEIPTLMVDVRAFEPHLALSGGKDGLEIMRRLVADAPGFLDEGGVLAVELGFGQAADVVALFERAGFVEVAARKDLGGIERVVSGVKG